MDPNKSTGGQSGLPGLASAASATQDGIERHWTGAEEDQGEGDRCEGKREFVTTWTAQAILEVYLPDCHGHVDEDRQRGEAGEEAEDHGDPAEELGSSGKIGEPTGQAKTAHKLHVIVKSAEDFGIAVSDHDDSERQAEHQQSERLQAVEIAQGVLRRTNRLQHGCSDGKSRGKW
jgi:hypothetical protein